ncbi:hypothetical protein CTAYLR_000149 [Chrysophaeum taylorii]|uniref:PBP domain-containing protein n=1 Tax=Chrysophaeum taylorii TaxID=2483200 RepID=A0AAD7UI84_9STRA|nr:hypothetical protein CTAYLR_000149 [Chrysophaeum taylorii]
MLLLVLGTSSGIELDGSGTTNPSKFYWEIMSLFEARAKPAVRMTYRAVGSSTGQYEFIGKDQEYVPYNDFGSGDIPIDEEDYANLTNLEIGVLHVPFSLGAMSFFHNVPGVDKLNMTACLLADIFNRDITTWDDSEILAVNPNLDVPTSQPILVYHRVLGSSTTSGITTYLNSACPSKWPADQVGSTITWADGTFEAQGSGGMSEAISGNEYAIGYIDSGHGHDDGLSEIELENQFGTYQDSRMASARGGVKAAADEALDAGILPSSPASDFSAVSLHNMPGEFTWPIVAISYIYMRTDQTTVDPDTAALMYAFVEYVLSDDGQLLLEDYNFEGVPTAVLKVANASLGMLLMPGGAPSWSFESATDPGSGQEDYVISGKRRSFYEYAVSELEAEAATVSDLEDLAATVASIQESTHSHSSSGDCSCDDDDHDHLKAKVDVAIALAVVAIFVAIIAVAMAWVATSKVNRIIKSGFAPTSSVSVPCGKPNGDAYEDLNKQPNNEQL